jgi:hypothetical protein
VAVVLTPLIARSAFAACKMFGEFFKACAIAGRRALALSSCR